MIGRRAFAAGAAALAAAPFAARAQAPGRTYRIALWVPALRLSEIGADGTVVYQMFFAELARLGFVEGRNLIVDRYANEGQTDRYEPTAREIVASRPDLIVPVSSGAALLLLGLTTAIPMVMPAVIDPVAAGLAPSLARPGGNLTGFTTDAGIELNGLRLQLLKEAVPRISRIGYLVNRGAAAAGGTMDRVLRQAAEALGCELSTLVMDGPFNEAAYAAAFADLAHLQVDGLLVSPAAEHLANRQTIVALAAAARLPVIYPWRDFAEDGGLMSYGVNRIDNYRKSAAYVARILNGEKPGDLPIQQPTTFEVVVNVRAATALGLTLPETIFFRATEVIE